MIFQYLRNLLRPFRRNVVYTLINLLGLTIGLTCAFLILLYVSREYSFDRNHKNRDQVYRILTHYRLLKWIMPLSPYPLGPVLQSDYPEIGAFTRMSSARLIIRKGDHPIPVRRTQGVDPGVSDLFTIHFLKGAGKQLFTDPNQIALSKSLAKEIFGEERGLGSVLECDVDGKPANFTVSAIYEDLPVTSTFRPDAMIPVKWTLVRLNSYINDPGFETSFDHIYFQTYFLLRPGVDPGTFRNKLRQAGVKYLKPELNVWLDMQCLKDIYLHSADLGNNRTVAGDLKQIRIFIIIGVLILLIAAFNYVILSAARSALRYREVGMRKVVGATRGILSAQIFGESLLISFLALPIAFVAMLLLLPVVNNLFNTSMTFIFRDQWVVVLGFVVLCFITGILSGSYLAFYLARLNPAEVLRNKAALSGRSSIFYKILVVVQVIIFIGLLSASGLIFHQIGYVEKMDLGLDRNNLVIVYADPGKLQNSLTYVDEIRKSPLIINASTAMECPPARSRGVSPIPRYDDPSVTVNVEGLSVGMDFIETFRFRLIAGRSFSRDFAGDMDKSVVLNETAVRELGIQGDPIGQKVMSFTIIGVIKDFNLHSAREKVAPLYLNLSDKFIYQLPVRLADGWIKEGVDFLRAEWLKIAPDQNFEYQFFDDALSGIYEDDRNFGRNIRIFTTLATIIALLGLFGLSLFMASRRTREIGIRKINGAETVDIILLLNKGFIILVLIAFVISIPLTAWVMEKWLAGFAFRAPVGVWVYIKSGIIALAVVLLTVSIHAWRASRTNPAEVIKCD
ncbi:MAG: ABC transporter permease [Bacteroidia bacterium]|nr:ABC transporter permease [Bacteroidia bacterium]